MYQISDFHKNAYQVNEVAKMHLQKLLTMVCANEVKDKESEKSVQEELVEDMMSLIASFNSK